MIFSFPDPAKGSFLQTNRGNILGTFWSSMALDLQSNPGIVRIAQRLRIASDTTDDADLGLPVAFQAWDTGGFAVCGTRVFKNMSTPNTAWTEDGAAGAPTTCNSGSDLGIFDTRLWVTAAGALLSKAANGGGTGVYTSRDTFASPGPHPVTDFAKFPRLYYTGETGEVRSIDAANVVSNPSSGDDYALDIGDKGSITSMKANSEFIWVGTNANVNTTNLQARVLQWDGISQQITNEFIIKGARAVVAIVIKNDIPFCLDSLGILSKYNGYAFQEVGRLPFGPFPTATSASSSKNGMIVTQNDTILVTVNNVNQGATATYNENNFSGVFEWSEEYGFVQKFVFTYNKQGSATITDFGQNQISAIGAILDTTNMSSATADYSGQYIVGATYFYDATNTRSAIFFDDTLNTTKKKGYFVTDWLFAKEIQDKFTHLYGIFRRLLASTDTIVFKYRLNEVAPLYADITWVDTTHFTTTTDPSAYWTSGVGGEVEVLRGPGSGTCVHITSVVNNAGTYTVTLEEAVTGVTTQTAKVRFQHWVKINDPINTQVNSSQQMAISGNPTNPDTFNTRIQLKCCMTFTGDDELHKFYLASKEDLTINL